VAECVEAATSAAFKSHSPSSVDIVKVTVDDAESTTIFASSIYVPQRLHAYYI
jgi:hypothetical protein